MNRSFWKACVGPALLALSSGLTTSACIDKHNDDNAPAVTARRGALSATTGDLLTILTWGAQPLSASDTDIYSIKAVIPFTEMTAVQQSDLSYLVSDLPPGDASVHVHAFGCTQRLPPASTATIAANAIASLAFPLDAATGRMTGSILLGGLPVPNDASVRISSSCDFTVCPVGNTGCEFFITYDTTVGALLGKLLPTRPLQVAVYSDHKAGSFTLNLPGGTTTDLGTITAAAGRFLGRVFWNGAQVPNPAAQGLTITGQGNFGGGSTQPPRRPWITGFDTVDGYNSGLVPPGDYGLRLTGVLCSNAEGSDAFVTRAGSVADGQETFIDLDLATNAGLVRGDFTVNHAAQPVTLRLNGGDCNAIATDAAGHLEVFLAPGLYLADVLGAGATDPLGSITIEVSRGDTSDLGALDFTSASLLPRGSACTPSSACADGHCVDGVCCESICGDGDPTDCQACSVAAGGTADGTCSPRATGTSCGAPPGMCETAAVCLGDLACPGPTPLADCSFSSVSVCSGSCQPIDLRNGLAFENGISVQFMGNHTAGQLGVRPCEIEAPPSSGYEIIAGTDGKAYCWDILVGVALTYSGPINVCIHYPTGIATTDENTWDMIHDDGGGGVFPVVTSGRGNPGTHQICGSVTSLSPFALVRRRDTTSPVFSGGPGPAPLVAYATSTAGARVTYPLPTAVDTVDGPRPVACLPASGTTFPPGTTPVICRASDNSGNTANRSFSVSVQYQAPSDGSFFLKPIRPDGASVFHIARPVPVRFKLTGVSAKITNLVARLVVTKLSSVVQGTANDTSDETVDDTGFVFTHRPGQDLYLYRWRTRDQAPGTYQLRADLGDGVTHTINVSLRR